MRKWMERRAGTANCSPALVVLGCVIAIAITCYIYRHIIIETLIAFAAAAGILLLLVAVIALVVNARRYQKRRTQALIDAPLAKDTEPMTQLAEPIDGSPVAAMPKPVDAEAMARTAEWLAEEGTELAWTSDGKLVAKGDQPS
jgi:hypothetical protein